jgi:hypothetical protein
MARYDVVEQGRDGVQRSCRLLIEAASPGEALVAARRSMDRAGSSGADCLYAVYRRRRARGRRLVGLFGGQGGDGGAGVREPRRPRPDLPSLTTSRPLPR